MVINVAFGGTIIGWGIAMVRAMRAARYRAPLIQQLRCIYGRRDCATAGDFGADPCRSCAQRKHSLT